MQTRAHKCVHTYFRLANKMGAYSIVCQGVLIALLVVLIVVSGCAKQGGRRGTFIPNCYDGITSGMMPSIDSPPPTPCGVAGVDARGKQNCCGGFNVPPVVRAL